MSTCGHFLLSLKVKDLKIFVNLTLAPAEREWVAICRVLKGSYADLAAVGIVHHDNFANRSEKTFHMIRQMKQHGLSARFFAFVLITMASSTFIGGVLAGLGGYLRTGDAEMILAGLFIFMVGGGFVIPVALLLWIAPSALIFSASMALLEERLGTKKAAQWSGSITALVAAVVTTYVASNFGRSFDPSVMFFVGPAAVCIAPLGVRIAYSHS